jgi:hypothetical protein
MSRTSNTSQLDRYLNRVGVKPVHRLKWALGIVNRFRGQHGINWSPGDWDNACLELAVFASIGDSLPGWGGTVEGSISERPSIEEAEAALERMAQMVESAEAREPISLGKILPIKLAWSKRSERYTLERYDDRATWHERITYNLFYLIKDEGHRVRRCPSKLPHQGKPCHNYFVKAKRAIYCSIPCAAREMTRAKRIRDDTAEQTHQKKGAKRHGTKRR